MSLFNNAIGWANFQISGGLRRTVWVCGGVAVALPLLMFCVAWSSAQPFERSLAGWYYVLGAIQGSLLTFAMPGRVHGAIRRDRLTAKILESHRLMPVPPAHAIVGYIVGPNLLIGALVATVFAIGLYVATLANQDWRGWIVLHVAGVGLSATLCCLVAFSSQWVPRLNPALILILFGLPFGYAMAAFVPAARVMFAPFLAHLPELQQGEVKLPQVVAAASQLAFAAILFVGACRRYRRDDVPVLGLGWGLAMLALWVGLTLVGTLRLEEYAFVLNRYDEDRLAVPSYVISVSLSMLLAIGPIAGTATQRLAWSERKRIDPYFDERRPAPLWAATLATLLVLAALLAAAPREVDLPSGLVSPDYRPTWRHVGLTLGVIGVFGVTVAMLARGAARMRVAPAAVIGVWIALLWAIPPIVDGASAAVTPGRVRFPRPLGAASPPFALAAAWTGDLNAATAGLIAQAAAVPLLFLVWQLIKRRNRTSTTPVAIANV